MTEMENVECIKITDDDSCETYTLDFTRATVKQAEKNGFRIGELDCPSKVSELIYYSFKANHPLFTPEKVETIIDSLFGGVIYVPSEVIVRLVALYDKAWQTLSAQEREAKKSKVTIKM